MEDFQNKIKSFVELSQYVFNDFFEKKKKFFLLVSILLIFQLVSLFLINRSWAFGFLGTRENFWSSFFGSSDLLVTGSIAVVLFFLALNFSVVTAVREEFPGTLGALKRGLISTVKLVIPIALLGGIVSEFFLLSESFKNFIIFLGFLVYLWTIFACYVSLKEKRRGMESFIRALHLLRKNFLGAVWKILVFGIIFSLALVALTFPLILLYFFFPLSGLLTIVGGLLVFVLSVLVISLSNIYLSNLCENVWKIRKHIAFYPPPPLYNLAVTIFLLVVFLILVLATIALGY
jgi:hypothetical protein